MGLFNEFGLGTGVRGLSIVSWLVVNFLMFEVDELLLGEFPNGVFDLDDFIGLDGGPKCPFWCTDKLEAIVG